MLVNDDGEYGEEPLGVVIGDVVLANGENGMFIPEILESHDNNYDGEESS
jgi:hypothetical protein